METTPIFEEISRILNAPIIELGEITISGTLLLKFVLFWLAVFVIAAFVRRRLVFGLLARTSVDEGVKYAAARIASYLVWVAGAFIGLPLIGIRLSSIMVALGAIGLGIGLGLQKIAENFVSGLILLLARPIKVGDRIKVDDVVGTVVEIHARVTMVRTNDNVIILVPNAELVSGRVTNLTHNDRVVRFAFSVGVSYSSDPNTVRKLLLEVAEEHAELLPRPTPDVLFREFADSSLNFVLRAHCASMVHRPEVLRSEVNFAIWYKLKAAGIQIPFPQRDVHIKSMPDGLDVPASAPRS